MRATKVLKQYAAGRRDFSGANLRGQSFKGQTLSGANFSGADIRGANFTNANLIGANFQDAKAGLQRRWAISLVIVSWILSALSGVVLGLAIILASGLVQPIYIEQYPVAPGLIVWIALASFFILTIQQGYVSALVTLASSASCLVALFGILAGTVEGAGTGATAVAVAIFATGVLAGAVVLAEASAGGVVLGIAVTVAVTVAITKAVAQFGQFVGSMAKAVDAVNSLETKTIAGVVAGMVALIGGYIGWRALSGDERDAWIRTFAIAFAATGGTSFRHADLTEADFTSATLKSTDFRNATLTRTNFHQTKKLDRARVGKTILIDTKVRDLLVTHRGAKQSYIACNLN